MSELCNIGLFLVFWLGLALVGFGLVYGAFALAPRRCKTCGRATA